MSDTYYFFISFLGAVQGILLSFLLLRRKQHPISRYLLGVYILIFSLGLFERYVENHFTSFLGQLILSFLEFSNFLYGPLLFLFVYFLSREEHSLEKKYWWHFAPFLIFFSGRLFFLISGISVVSLDYETVRFFLFEILILQMLGYNSAAILLLDRYRQNILHFYPNMEPRDIGWLRNWFLLITFIYILSFLITHLLIFGIKNMEPNYAYVQLLITIAIYILSYKMILRPDLFLFAPKKEIPAESSKYLRSGLKTEQLESYAEALLSHMKEQKPYRDPDFSLQQLSETLSISKNHLTQVINEKLRKNFYEFVNEYRVEEVKQLIHDPHYSHLTLSALGLEAGFKSKTAFNNNFKKLTGYTPSEWKSKK